MAITKEQAADLVITGPGDVRDKIIEGIEAYLEAYDHNNRLIVTTVPVVFEDNERDDAYDMIDRFMRNNLDDSEYAEYSSALEKVIEPPATPDKVAVLVGALEEITNDYADRFDLESASTNPGIKYVVAQARAALAYVKE